MLHSDSCKNDSVLQCKKHYLFRAGQIDGITLKSGFQIKSFLLGLVEVYWLKAYPQISVTGKNYFEFNRQTMCSNIRTRLSLWRKIYC